MVKKEKQTHNLEEQLPDKEGFERFKEDEVVGEERILSVGRTFLSTYRRDKTIIGKPKTISLITRWQDFNKKPSRNPVFVEGDKGYETANKYLEAVGL